MMRQWGIGIILLGGVISVGQAGNEGDAAGDSHLRPSVIQHVVRDSTGWAVRSIDLKNQTLSQPKKTIEFVDLTKDDLPLPHTTKAKPPSPWTPEKRREIAALIREKYLRRSESTYPTNSSTADSMIQTPTFPLTSTSSLHPLHPASQEDLQPRLEGRSRKRAYLPAFKNMILKALASGEHPDVLATTHNMPKDTIKSWQRRYIQRNSHASR